MVQSLFYHVLFGAPYIPQYAAKYLALLNFINHRPTCYNQRDFSQVNIRERNLVRQLFKFGILKV